VTYEAIRYELIDGIATITLNRPQAYNAFDRRMHIDLARRLDEAERDPAARCLVITGAGKAFCSGQDLKELTPGVSFRALLSERYRVQFRSVGLNLYRDGDDSVAWHGDNIGRGRTHDTLVAIVSLGDPRRLALRPRGGGESLSFELGHGDLLVMGGSCQRTWEHAVPKVAHAGPRISVQFRPLNVF